MTRHNRVSARSAHRATRLPDPETHTRMDWLRAAFSVPHRRRAALVAVLATELAIAARLLGL